ncbi:hypothetical protein DENSPDRAFT_854625 [Dentipellis sp. KUC8613]|nr:hypothetical protein DENSPDRAFT_854625 [Dentipellis sp. KUC8613]
MTDKWTYCAQSSQMWICGSIVHVEEDRGGRQTRSCSQGRHQENSRVLGVLESSCKRLGLLARTPRTSTVLLMVNDSRAVRRACAEPAPPDDRSDRDARHVGRAERRQLRLRRAKTGACYGTHIGCPPAHVPHAGLLVGDDALSALSRVEYDLDKKHLARMRESGGGVETSTSSTDASSATVAHG